MQDPYCTSLSTESSEEERRAAARWDASLPCYRSTCCSQKGQWGGFSCLQHTSQATMVSGEVACHTSAVPWEQVPGWTNYQSSQIFVLQLQSSTKLEGARVLLHFFQNSMIICISHCPSLTISSPCTTHACGKANRSLSNICKQQIHLQKIIYIEVNLSRKITNI